MMGFIVIAVMALIMILPILANKLGLQGKKLKMFAFVNTSVYFLMLVGLTATLFTGSAMAADAETAVAAAGMTDRAMGFLSAALVTGLACFGAGIAVASSASAALGAISENPGILGKSLIFVSLAEGIALYGVLISFVILGRL